MPKLEIDTLKNHRALMGILMILAIMMLGLTAFRVNHQYSMPGSEFDWANRGHSDFHNGGYYPALAYREGFNPYAKALTEHFPVSAPARLCPPVVFWVHLPFTMFDLRVADACYFVFNSLLLLALALAAVRMATRKPNGLLVLLVFCLLLVSRPGHITLFTGYYTLQLVLGTIVAIHFAERRPWLSGLAMVFASGKPTYVLPLAALLLARRNYRAVVIGLTMCTVAGLVGLGWLAFDHTPAEIIAGIREGQAEFHSDATEFPINTWTRVDLLGMAAKFANWIPTDRDYLIGMIVLLIAPGWAISRAAPHESNCGATGLTAFIVVLTILLAIYHHSYDCLLLVVPWVGVTFFHRSCLPELSSLQRWAVACLTAVPAGNYLATKTVRDQLGMDQLSPQWQAITMINGFCLLAALIILMMVAVRQSGQRATNPE